MQKVYINARFLTQNITGVQRYANEFVKSLDNLISQQRSELMNYSFFMLTPQKTKYDPHLKNIPLKHVGHFEGHLWEQCELPFYAGDGLLLNLCNTAPLLKQFQVVTIHDSAISSFPEAYSFFFRTWYKFLFKILGKTSKRIITDSLFSKKELITNFKIKENKIVVIYLGREHVFLEKSVQDVLQRNNLENGKFVLAVSSMNPSKNFQSIVRAIELLADNNEKQIDFVIAGGVNPRIFNQSQKPLPSSVKYLGYIKDGELRSLYENAACFVFPSLYEGFGLPPLEAMAIGCPVIVSDVASLPEICGDAVLYCNPYDPQNIADKIFSLMNDSELRAILKQKGLEQAKNFSWEKCSIEILKVIEEVLGQ
jgi:glycosyltransferase involved in cell wall biosynthesis